MKNYNSLTLSDHIKNITSLINLPQICRPVAPIDTLPDGFFSKKPCLPTDYLGPNRLGFYYQWLISQQIASSPDYALQAEELTLYEGKRTIGAIDFLVKEINQHTLSHWEVAIKFYLHHKGRWLGPNANDSLENKYQRMCEHQLKLTTSPQFKSQFPFSPAVTKQRLIMQGCLFAHINEVLPPMPDWINSDAIGGRWCYFDERPNVSWFPVDKVDWLSPLTAPKHEIINTKPSRAIMCINDAGQRLFIVPDDWPNLRKR